MAMLLFCDGTVPTGWTCESDSGDPYYEKCIRGESPSEAGTSGGADTHTHIEFSKLSCSSPSSTVNTQIDDGSSIANDHHQHGGGDGEGPLSLVVDAITNFPEYRDLKIIKCNTGIPSSLPAGVIAIFDDSPPVGWTQYSAQNDKYIRGKDVAGGSGGSNTHTHTVTGNSGTNNYGTQAPSGSGVNVCVESHSHSINFTTNAVDKQPPYLGVILAKKDADGEIPEGLIAFFDNDPGGSWEILSNPGGDFYQRFVVAKTSYGAKGGTATHEHTATGTTGAGGSARAAPSGGSSVAAPNHTHTMTIRVYDTEDPYHLPSYINVVFAKYKGGTVLGAGLQPAPLTLFA